jgi:signal transduction histidine kinase/DNA-binding response OmpR family regulator
VFSTHTFTIRSNGAVMFGARSLLLRAADAPGRTMPVALARLPTVPSSVSAPTAARRRFRASGLLLISLVQRGVIPSLVLGVVLAGAMCAIMPAARAVSSFVTAVAVFTSACVIAWHARSAPLAGGLQTLPVTTPVEPPADPRLCWLVDACPDAVVVTDVVGSVLQANRLCGELFGEGLQVGASFVEGRTIGSRITDQTAFASTLAQLYAQPDRSATGEITHLEAGQLRVFAWVSEPVRDTTGAVIARGFLFHDRTTERELAALKSDFLSTVTHELRTPLTSIKGSLQLVLGKAALSPIERELLDISQKNTDRLIRLINDILDISQLELGKMDLAFATTATAPLIEEAVAGLRAYAAGRDIAMGCEIEPDLPAVEGDRDRLIQVLTNLLSNAVKFSPVGGRVLVRAARVDGHVAIAIRDWGVGIRASDQDRLFERFHRLHRGSSEEPGTGLGLAISKAITERHGGHITVDSCEAEGSTFTVFIPLSSPPSRVSTSAGQQVVAPTTAERATLLLIDDDADLGTVLEVSLGGAFRLLRVERGVQALDVARAARPDLILLDVVLPDLSGYDVLRILQHSAVTDGIPVVMLTVQPERELACRLGATEVVAKPVDIDELRRVIDSTLMRRSPASGLRIALGPLRSRPACRLVAALEADGHAVFTVDDPWELLRCADERAPDVAVVEAVAENGGDGTVAFLRGHVSTRRLPLVLLTERCDDRPFPVGCMPISPSAGDAEVVRAVEQAARPSGAVAS